jgi:hypothetical protein
VASTLLVKGVSRVVDEIGATGHSSRGGGPTARLRLATVLLSSLLSEADDSNESKLIILLFFFVEKFFSCLLAIIYLFSLGKKIKRDYRGHLST